MWIAILYSVEKSAALWISESSSSSGIGPGVGVYTRASSYHHEMVKLGTIRHLCECRVAEPFLHRNAI